MIEPGQPVPALTLEDQSGQPQALPGAGPVVVFFYPKDDTPGCTKEACGFRDMLDAFAQLGVRVLGVSGQDSASKARFAKKHELTFPILADEDAAACQAWGVWQEKSMYGRTYMGIVRTTYLIDQDGLVARRWDSVKVPGHVEAVLAAAGELSR
ncbi:MAG: peroxiredoxin [Phycisphaerales bacterium]|nr:peroxiredoxin [Phycisphaerales bacterium]